MGFQPRVIPQSQPAFGARVVDRVMREGVLMYVGGTAGGRLLSHVKNAKSVGKHLGRVLSVGKH